MAQRGMRRRGSEKVILLFQERLHHRSGGRCDEEKSLQRYCNPLWRECFDEEHTFAWGNREAVMHPLQAGTPRHPKGICVLALYRAAVLRREEHHLCQHRLRHQDNAFQPNKERGKKRAQPCGNAAK